MPDNILHKQSIGTINVRGIKNEHEKKTLVNDALSFNIQVLGISETHIRTVTDLVPGNKGLEDHRAT